MKHKGTGNHMNMTGGNNGTEGTHGTGGTHGGTMKVKLIKAYSEPYQTSKIEIFCQKMLHLRCLTVFWILPRTPDHRALIMDNDLKLILHNLCGGDHFKLTEGAH